MRRSNAPVQRTLGMLLIVGGLVSPPVCATEIVLVKSADTASTTLAANSFKKLSTSGDVLEVDLKGGSALDQAVLGKLRTAPPKVLVAIGDAAAKAAKDAGLKSAIVYAMVDGPDKLGLQGDNIGGCSASIPVKAELEALASIAPSIKKIGVLHDSAAASVFQAAEVVAKDLGITLLGRAVSGPTALPPAVRELLAEVDGLLLLADGGITAPESLKYILNNALVVSKPALVWSDQYFSLGAVMALMPDPNECGKLAGELSNKALKGDTSFKGNVPAKGLRLTINTRTAENIGLTIDVAGFDLDGNFASKMGTSDAPPLMGSKPAAVTASAVPATGSGDSAEPQLLERADVVYPIMALKQKKEGQVVLEVKVGADGKVVDAKVLKGSSIFNDAAIDAVKRYKFAPARRNGQPVEGTVQVSVSFKLSGLSPL